MKVVLFEPEIPPNTGNIARLCVATNTPLHLIEPLGFSLEDKYLKRAGLDYWPYLELFVWKNWESFLKGVEPDPEKMIFTTKRAKKSIYEHSFLGDEFLIFGPETRGLPDFLLNSYPHNVYIPMWGKTRSLNLSSAVAICVYEAYRQVKKWGYLNG
ncbi:tRNA (cytidine(34)-2'-O)-methyltransferase [Desulfothermus naphthae]